MSTVSYPLAGTRLALPIRSLHRFGFFVELSGDLEGFVHVTQISRNLNRQTTEGLKQGQTVTMWVLDANEDTGRVALTMIAPNAPSMRALNQGQRLTGVVTSVQDDLGAFVDIGAEKEGLVHISEMSKSRVARASDITSEGQTVTVWVKSVDLQKARIHLSMMPPPSITVHDLHPGMVLEGIVVGFHTGSQGTHDGAFIDVDADRQGWLHVSEIAYGYLPSASSALSIDQRVRVRVLSVDTVKRQFSLTMKGT
jgi:small subunit ribosomal protein S1